MALAKESQVPIRPKYKLPGVDLALAQVRHFSGGSLRCSSGPRIGGLLPLCSTKTQGLQSLFCKLMYQDLNSQSVIQHWGISPSPGPHLRLAPSASHTCAHTCTHICMNTCHLHVSVSTLRVETPTVRSGS
jgi:hypothetical protein